MGAKPTSGRRQLSVGVPQRLSAERLLAAQLHRLVCNASATCPALEEALAGACAGQDCMRRGAFAGALLNRSHFEAPARREQAASDALWQRSWVWCPHSRAPTGEFAQCSGSVSRTAWLNTSTRAQGCAASIPKTSSSSTRVNFCLLTAKTQQLCAKMVKWRRDAQGIVCRASGRCPSSDFFYSPTTFDLREQQFVYDSVLDFYRTDAQRACEAGAQASAQPERPPRAQRQRVSDRRVKRVLVVVPREVEVDAGLDGAAAGVAPRGTLAAGERGGLENLDRKIPGGREQQVRGSGKSGEAAADNPDAHRLGHGERDVVFRAAVGGARKIIRIPRRRGSRTSCRWRRPRRWSSRRCPRGGRP